MARNEVRKVLRVVLSIYKIRLIRSEIVVMCIFYFAQNLWCESFNVDIDELTLLARQGL